MSRWEYKYKNNGLKCTVTIEPDSDSDTNNELDDNTEDGVSNPKCSFNHCIFNETSNAQCQDPIHLTIHYRYENNYDDDDDIAALSDNELILPGRDTPYSPPVSDDDDH